MFVIKLLRFGTFQLRLYHVSSETCFYFFRETRYVSLRLSLALAYFCSSTFGTQCQANPPPRTDRFLHLGPVLLDSFHYASLRFCYVLLRFKMAVQFMLLFGRRLRSLCTLQLWDICLRLFACVLRLKKHTHVRLRFKLTFHYVYRWPPPLFEH